jgi:hypothetical protein
MGMSMNLALRLRHLHLQCGKVAQQQHSAIILSPGRFSGNDDGVAAACRDSMSCGQHTYLMYV